MKALITTQKDLNEISIKVILNVIPFLTQTFYDGNIVMEGWSGEYTRPYISKTVEKKTWFKTTYKYDYVPLEDLLYDILFTKEKKYNLTPGKRLKVFIKLLDASRNLKDYNLEYILDDFELETLNLLYAFINSNKTIIKKRWN